MGYSFFKKSNTSMLNVYEKSKNQTQHLLDVKDLNRNDLNSMLLGLFPEYAKDVLGGIKLDLISRVMLHSKSDVGLEMHYSELVNKKLLPLHSRIGLFFKKMKTDIKLNLKKIEVRFLILLAFSFILFLFSLFWVSGVNSHFLALSAFVSPIPLLLAIYCCLKVSLFKNIKHYSYNLLNDYNVDLSKPLIEQLPQVKDFLCVAKVFNDDFVKEDASNDISRNNDLLRESFSYLSKLENKSLSKDLLLKWELDLRDNLNEIACILFYVVRGDSLNNGATNGVVSFLIGDVNAYEQSVKGNVGAFLKNYVNRFSGDKDFFTMAEVVKANALKVEVKND